jgi:hypothetical protein
MVKKTDCCGPGTAQESKWRAESDAETLRRAAEISGDKSRLRAAQSHVRQSIREMQKVVGTGGSSKGRSNSLGFAGGKGRR